MIKSVYDPSPVGYSLPASNAFTGFTTTGWNVGDENNPVTPEQVNAILPFDKGYYFYTKQNKQGIPFFFHAFGFRFCNTGSLDHVTTHGYYWVSGPDNRPYGRHLDFDSGYVYPLVGTNRSYGFPVRSAEERETHKFNIKQEMDGLYYNLWSTDNARTDANDDKVIKSVYDPSPVGYSLPASNAFTGFTTTGNYTATSSEFNVNGDFDKGWYFYTKPGKIGDKIFFNVTGNRYYSTGTLENFYNRGHYLSAGPGNLNYSRFFDFGAGYVNPLNNYNKGYCFTVRSAEEKVLKCALEEVANDV